MQIRIDRLKAALKAIQLQQLTLIALLGCEEKEFGQLLSGRLEEPRGSELRVAIEKLLRLEASELAEIERIPDRKARRAAAKQLAKATESVKRAFGACVRGGGASYCDGFQTQLDGLGRLGEELNDEGAKTADDEESDE